MDFVIPEKASPAFETADAPIWRKPPITISFKRCLTCDRGAVSPFAMLCPAEIAADLAPDNPLFTAPLKALPTLWAELLIDEITGLIPLISPRTDDRGAVSPFAMLCPAETARDLALDKPLFIAPLKAAPTAWAEF